MTSNHHEITGAPRKESSSDAEHYDRDANEKDEKVEIAHIDHDNEIEVDDEATIRGAGDGEPHYTAADAKHSVGLALIDQINTIPSAGDRKVTTKREYWSYIAFAVGAHGIGIGTYGGIIQQALLYQQYPGGRVEWGGSNMTLPAMILNLNGILFAVQVVLLLFIGPYADYGNWRAPFLLTMAVIQNACIFGFAGLTQPSQWQAANALYVTGNIARNLLQVFYHAAFPAMVRDLPKMIESEQQVLEAKRGNSISDDEELALMGSPEDHAMDDMLERSKIFNYVNIFGSLGILTFLGISVGIAFHIGQDNDAQLRKGYQIIIAMLGGMCVTSMIPYFIYDARRPGQKVPDNTSMLMAGPKQVWHGLKNIVDLKQAIIYLVAFFILNDVLGAAGNALGILQNETVQFSTVLNSVFNLLAYVTGGSGTVVVHFVQRRFKLSVKTMLVYGVVMAIMPTFWAFLGNFTTVIGFHNTWEFYLRNAWNFMTAAWGAYNITMITEVAPAPKMFLFMSLFNTVGETSSFIGPFVTSAIVDRAGGSTHAAFYFLFPLSLIALVIVCFISPAKAKIDVARYLEKEARSLYGQQERPDEKELQVAQEIRA